MTSYVLDASALLRFLNNEPGAIEVENLIKAGTAGTAELLMSAVNWSEVLHYVLKVHGPTLMATIESRLQSLPIRVLSADAIVSRLAAEFRFRHKIPFADSFAGSLAEQNQATLVTCDYDFHGLNTTFPVRLLSSKPKRRNP